MNHPYERISAYADGELTDSEERSVEAHLAVCTECARELALIRALGGAMRSTLVAETEQSLWEKVHRRVTAPVGWLLSIGGVTVWAALAVIEWFKAGGLTVQWLAELFHKFNQLFTLMDSDRYAQSQKERPDVSPWARLDKVVTSLEMLARGDEHRQPRSRLPGLRAGSGAQRALLRRRDRRHPEDRQCETAGSLRVWRDLFRAREHVVLRCDV